MADATQEPTIKIQFKPGVTSPTAHVFHVGFNRAFVRAEQPFEVAVSDWEQHIARTEIFEAAPTKKAAPPPPAKEDGKNSEAKS